MRIKRFVLAMVAGCMAVGPAFGQSLDQAPTKPIAELLNDGFTVASTSTNGRPGEVVLTLRREAKHYVCALTEIRGSGYSDAKAKPVANPCIPLN